MSCCFIACQYTYLYSYLANFTIWLSIPPYFNCLTEKVLKRKVLKPSSQLAASGIFVSASGRDPGASQCLNIQAQSDTNLKTFSPDLIQPEGTLLFITPNVNGSVRRATLFLFLLLTWFCWSGWTAYHCSALFCSGREHPRCHCAYDPV